MRKRKLSIRSARGRAIVCLLTSSFALTAHVGRAQQLEAVRVISRPLDQTVILPGEFTPYLAVAIHAKVAGFVQRVEVDRGSVVKEGQLLATIIAPELIAQRAEAEAKVQTAAAQQAEAEARVTAAQSTYERMKAASATAGVIAGIFSLLTAEFREGDQQNRVCDSNANGHDGAHKRLHVQRCAGYEQHQDDTTEHSRDGEQNGKC